MPDKTMIDYGKIAYEAYGRSVSWRNFRGDAMPEWDDLPLGIRTAWIQAAMSARRGYA